MSHAGKPPSTLSSRLVALQHHDFRLLWFGQFVSVIGTQMQLAAVDWHVYERLQGQDFVLTLFGHPLRIGAQALGLGTMGLVRVIPVVLFAMLGGLVADAQDRRLIMMFTQSAQALFALALGLLTLTGHDSLIAIYLLTAAMSAAAAFDNPARQSLIPNLVPREHLTNAISLNTVVLEIATITGPTITGGMLGFLNMNIGWIYVVNAVSFAAVLTALALMRYRGRVEAANTGLGWKPMIEGLRFVYHERIVRSTMLVDFFATFFSSANTMLPIIAGNILHVGAAGYGILRTAQSAGAVVAGAVLSLRKDIYRQGVVLLVAVVIYGAATAVFGVSTAFALSYLMLATTGAADTVSMVIRNTIRQVITPDHLRGRMTSVNMMFYMGGPQLGEMEAGLVAAALGVPFSILTGGLATVLLTLWIAWKYPGLRGYTSDMLDEAALAAAK